MDNHNYLLIIIFYSFLLDNFNHFVSCHSLDISYHNSIILNNKLYFIGGYSHDNYRTSQIIYIDLSTSFSLYSLPIKEDFPEPDIPPFDSASLAFSEINNNSLYVIAGFRNISEYGSIVYSINTNLFDSWTPETFDGQSQLSNLTGTIYSQDSNGNTYIMGYNNMNIYKFDISNLTFITLTSINNDLLPTAGINNLHSFNYHLLDDENIIYYIGSDMTTVNTINIINYNYNYLF
jgi:hypothetical protein